MAVFAQRFPKLYHLHLKKCGGTSLNRWLSWHVPDDRLWSGAQMKRAAARLGPPHGHRHAAITAFSWTDAVCTHLPFHPHVPEDTFCITVLREPRQRVLSQIADWRREASANHAPGPEATAAKDAARLPIARFLERYRRSEVGGTLDNYMTRALAWGLVTPGDASADPASMLPHALCALEERYHVVGLTARMAETRAAICDALGLVHDPIAGGPQNTTGSNALAAELDAEAIGLLDELTATDRVLYARAESLFNQRHAEAASRFDEQAFETRFAAETVQRLRLFARNGYAVASTRDRLVGSGMWGRDGEGTPHCSVWTGPSPRTVLYLPCPPGEKLSVKLWIRGYASERLRDQLHFEIDDRPYAHKFVEEPGWREAAVLEAHSTRPFLKITMKLRETLSSAEAGVAGGDSRRRGLAFDSYGWSLGTEGQNASAGALWPLLRANI